MKIMAVDYGDARTGLAVCDRTEFLASPVGIIEEKSFAKVAEKIVYACLLYTSFFAEMSRYNPNFISEIKFTLEDYFMDFYDRKKTVEQGKAGMQSGLH